MSFFNFLYQLCRVALFSLITGRFSFQISACLLINTLHGQLYLAAIIKADNFHLDHITFFTDICGLGNTLILHLRDVNKTVPRAKEIDKRPEIDRFDNLAGINLTQLRLSHNLADARQSVFEGLHGSVNARR